MEYASDELENLKTENYSLKQEIENLNQELHECKKNVKVLQAVQIECQNEIDMLQSAEIRQKQQYQEIIKQLEQNIHNMRDCHNEEKLAFENVIMKMEEKNVRVQSELEFYKESGNNTTNFVGDTSLLINEILSDSPEILENQQLKETQKQLQESNESLQKKVEEYEAEIEDLKECYSRTKKDLQEANGAIQFLNDEVCCLKAEIDSLRNQPLIQGSKGNSLFAEVDDRRVYLQDKIDKMKASYVAKSQENTQLQNTVHQLQLENMRLLEKWKSDVEEKDDDEYYTNQSLKSRIDTLEKLIENYKKAALEKPVVISKKSFEEIEFYDLTLKEKNKELQALRDEVNSKSLDKFMLSSALKEANEEKRKWKLEAMLKQHEVEILKRESVKEGRIEEKQCEEKSNLRNSSKKDVNRSDEAKIHKQPKKDLENGSDLTERLSDIREEYIIESKDEFKENNESQSPEFLKEYNCADHNMSNRRDTLLIDKEHIDKENTSDNKDSNINQAKRVTFAVNTISPKKTDRRGGRRIFVPKPIHFKD